MQVEFDRSLNGDSESLETSLFADRIRLEAAAFTCVTSPAARLVVLAADAAGQVAFKCASSNGEAVPGTSADSLVTIDRRAFVLYPFNQDDACVRAALDVLSGLLSSVCV